MKVGAKSPCKWGSDSDLCNKEHNSQGSDLLDKLAFSKDKLSFCGENRNRKVWNKAKRPLPNYGWWPFGSSQGVVRYNVYNLLFLLLGMSFFDLTKNIFYSRCNH